MPSGFMPNGMVANHSSAGSFVGPVLPRTHERLDRALARRRRSSANGGMIWPPGKTSIRNRPPLISSTTFASRWAAPWCMSSAAVQAVDIRHWTFGCVDDVRGIDDGGSGGGGQRTARLRNELASVGHDITPYATGTDSDPTASGSLMLRTTSSNHTTAPGLAAPANGSSSSLGLNAPTRRANYKYLETM